MVLTIPQTTALDYLQDQITREILFGGAAGPGKSTLGCYWQLKQRLKYPETRGLIGRSTLKTLKETTFVSFMKVAKMQGVTSTFKHNGQSNITYFSNGSEIYWKDLFYYPSDPDGDEFGSLELTDVFIDEASQVNVNIKNIVNSRIRHMLDEYNLVPKALYTTNPGKNWTKTEFRDPFVKDTLVEDKQFVPAALQSNSFITKFYEENLRRLPKALKERLLFSNWDYSDDPSQLITGEDIAAIFTNTHVKPFGKKYITADIARMGKDRIIVRVWHGWKVLKRFEYTKLRITETAEKIKSIMNEFQVPKHQTLCDEDGIGGGVVDILGCKGFVANSKPFDGYKNRNNLNYASLKDQCGWYLSDKITNGEVYEKAEQVVKDSIIEELEQIKDGGLNDDKKNKLVSKKEISAQIGRSPDDSDTYLMRSWFDLQDKYGMKVLN